MKKLLLALLLCGVAHAQVTPVIPSGTVLGNSSGSPAVPSALANVPIQTLQNALSSASVVRARDYGILAANSAAQNDTAFATLKTKLQSSSTTVWRVIFEPGTYVYTNNRWLWGVQNVIIDAYDAIFQNTSNSAWDQDKSPLVNGEIFGTYGDCPASSCVWSYTTGYKFNTVSPGATSITTTTAADAGNFTPGMKVLLHGYDQQGTGSVPPNLRYFESKTVATANGSTGVVTFTDQVQNYYDTRWWDTVTTLNGAAISYGQPRIVSLQRTDYSRPHFIWIRGATFLANPNAAIYGNYAQLPADTIVWDDVTAPSVSASQMDHFIMNRGHMSYNVEMDKLVDSAVIRDSVLDGTAAGVSGALSVGTGINTIAVLDTKVIGALIGLTPRHLFVNDCDITPLAVNATGINPQASFWPVTSVNVSNTTIHNTAGSMTNGVNIGNPTDRQFTVGTISGTNIQLTWNSTAQNLAYSIDYGGRLCKSDLTNCGVITGIYLSGGNTLVITGTWSAPTPGDTWNADVIQVVTDGGGNSIVGPTALPFWGGNNTLTYPAAPNFNTSVYTPQLNLGSVAASMYIKNSSGNLQFRNNSNSFYIDTSGVVNMQAQLSAFANFRGEGTVTLNNNNNGTVQIGTGSDNQNVTIGGASNHILLPGVTTGTNTDFVCMSSSNTLTLQTSACTISSLRYKEHVEDLQRSAFPELAKLRVAAFNMRERETPNNDPNYGSRQVGLIAENIAQVAPECAIYDDDMKTPKSYRQECVIALLVKGMQEQQREINHLKRRHH